MELKEDILCLAQDEVARSCQWYDSYEETEGLRILSLDLIPALKEEGYIFKCRIASGTVLMRNPFRKKEFIDIANPDCEELIINSKMGAIDKIAQELGAKHISGNAVFLEETKLTRETDGNIKTTKVSADLAYKKEQEEQYAKKYKLNRNYLGVFSEKSYRVAKKLLKEYNLESDYEISDLVEMRNPNKINTLCRQQVHMEVYQEINSCKDIAFSLSAMNIVDMGLQTKASIETRKRIVFESEIEF